MDRLGDLDDHLALARSTGGSTGIAVLEQLVRGVAVVTSPTARLTLVGWSQPLAGEARSPASQWGRVEATSGQAASAIRSPA